MQKGEALVNNMSIKGILIVLLAVTVVNCKEVRIYLKGVTFIFHQSSSLVYLVLPLQTLQDIQVFYVRLIVIVVMFMAPITLINGNSMKHDLLRGSSLIYRKDSLDTFSIYDLNLSIRPPLESVDYGFQALFSVRHHPAWN